MATTEPNVRPGRAIPVLQLILLSVATLYFGQPILMPFAMAVLLALLLSPVVHALERRFFGRVPAVVVVVVLISMLLFGVGWVASVQLVNLAGNLPGYKETLKTKLSALKSSSSEEGTIKKLQEAVTEISEVVEGETADGKQKAQSSPNEPNVAQPATSETPVDSPPPKPQIIQVVAEQRSAWAVIATIAAVAGPLATGGIVLVLVIFLLINEEDVRDRLVRLAGTGRLTLTTATIMEMRRRISRYLLINALINGGYGVAVGLGLLVIGVDYALFWGFLAATLRFVPYLGPIIASVLPVTMSFVQFPGWTPTLLTVGFFVVLELVTNNLIEQGLRIKSGVFQHA